VQITGVKSEWIAVTSGVPHGSVLGSVLFLIYINDLATDIYNKSVLNFADDTKIFAVCNDKQECAVLQNDITKLEKWANVWQMKFNVDKCKTMHLGHGNIKSEYWLDNKVSDSTHSEKDLGIWITDNMKLECQTTEACKKANRMLKLIKRTIVHKDQHILVALYKSLVCLQKTASRVLLLCLVAKIRER